MFFLVFPFQSSSLVFPRFSPFSSPFSFFSVVFVSPLFLHCFPSFLLYFLFFIVFSFISSFQLFHFLFFPFFFHFSPFSPFSSFPLFFSFFPSSPSCPLSLPLSPFPFLPMAVVKGLSSSVIGSTGTSRTRRSMFLDCEPIPTEEAWTSWNFLSGHSLSTRAETGAQCPRHRPSAVVECRWPVRAPRHAAPPQAPAALPGWHPWLGVFLVEPKERRGERRQLEPCRVVKLALLSPGPRRLLSPWNGAVVVNRGQHRSGRLERSRRCLPWHAERHQRREQPWGLLARLPLSICDAEDPCSVNKHCVRA